MNSISPGAVDTRLIDSQFKTREEADGTCAFFSQMRRQEPESLENGMTMRLA
ncbi:MAG: hypothetical protein ACLQVJ_10225 [Syntrophobacteraceae bacterium]